MDVTAAMYFTVCPLVFLASLVDSIGGGGGLISLPAYYLAGLPPTLAAGTNKLSACFGTLVASIRFGRGHRLLLRPALLAILGALPGAFIGAEILKRMDENTVRMIMLAGIPIMALVVAFKRTPQAAPKEMTRLRYGLCFLTGLGCGFYDGFFGPGAGTLMIMMFTWAAGMDMVTASGTAKPVNLASNTAALFSFLLAGKVLFRLAVPAIFCSIAGGWLGSKLALRVGARLVRWVMLGVLVLLVSKLAYEWLIAA